LEQQLASLHERGGFEMSSPLISRWFRELVGIWILDSPQKNRPGEKDTVNSLWPGCRSIWALFSTGFLSPTERCVCLPGEGAGSRWCDPYRSGSGKSSRMKSLAFNHAMSDN
jgi:hypothetical protein